MTPFDAIRREIEIELAALERRTGGGRMPSKVTIDIELDRDTGMPRTVECQEGRSRRIRGGEIASLPARTR